MLRLLRLFYTTPLRLRSVLRRGRVEQELDEEIRYHIEQRIEQETARGVPFDEARRVAFRAMDGLEQRKEECREMRRTQWLEQFLQDIRYGWRALLRSPGFAAVVLASLALGIGANTAIFSLVDKVMLESLPVERPREVVILDPEGLRNGWTATDLSWSYPSYQGIRDRQQPFVGLLAERTETVNFGIEGATRRATQSIVSGNYFELLGVRSMLGRVLSPDDDQTPGGHPVAMLSHAFWVEQLGSRADIVGSTIRLNGYPFTVVGVTEKGFKGLEVGEWVDVIVPAAMLKQVVTYGSALESRSAHIFHVYGRLKPGVTREQAEAQLQPVYVAELEQDVAAMGAQAPSDEGWREGRVRLIDGHRGTSGMRSALETPLTALMAMTVVVLLIACANIAGLLMARASSRRKEISVRLAIGASGGRIVRQLLAESALIAVLGGLAGLLVARWTINALVAEAGDGAQRLQLVTTFLDSRVLGFAFAASIATGVLFGLLPALHALRESVSANLKTGGVADRGGQVRLRRMLVSGQIALGLVLITGAGLFLRTLSNLRGAETGFRTERMVQFELNAGLAGYDRERATRLFDRILEELRAIPGVTSATFAIAPVLAGKNIGFGLDVEGHEGEGQNQFAQGNAVAPGYFPALGMPLVRGRDFTANDSATSLRVAVVNEAFAKHFFGDENPLGRKIGLGWGLGTRYFHEIIGVSKDARIANLRDEPARNFFIPYSQWNVLTYGTFYVRTYGDTSTLASPIRELVNRNDRDIPVVGYRTVDEQIDQLLRPERLTASLSAAFGALAAGLAAMGLYGVTAFQVARRTREIGIRMALGAERGMVLRMVLRDVAMIAAIGIAAGTALSLGLARYVESQLYGVAARDVVTIMGAAVLLGVVALASGWLPARRASRVEPVRALRQE